MEVQKKKQIAKFSRLKDMKKIKKNNFYMDICKRIVAINLI